MNILVVHDRQLILDEICKICREVFGQSASVDGETAYVGARQRLSERLYDIAIIDLTLPHFPTDKDTSFEVAANLIKELMLVDELNIPGDLIGITREPDALERIDVEVGSHLMAVIDECSITSWRSALRDRLNYVRRSGASRLRSLSRQFDYDICFITALDKEAKPYGSLLELTQDELSPKAKRFTFADRTGKVRQGVVVSIGRAGQPRSSSMTQIVLNLYRPRYVIMTGICGGVKGKLKIGDLALFEQVFDWDYGKWKTIDKKPVFVSRPEPISIRDLDIYEHMRRFVDDASLWIGTVAGASNAARHSPKSPSIEPVVAASGSAVVGHESIISQIHGLSDAISAVDMESYGMFSSCSSTNVVKPQFICMKAVSDYCDGNKNDRYHEFCSFLSASASAAIAFAKHYLPYES